MLISTQIFRRSELHTLVSLSITLIYRCYPTAIHSRGKSAFLHLNSEVGCGCNCLASKIFANRRKSANRYSDSERCSKSSPTNAQRNKNYLSMHGESQCVLFNNALGLIEMQTRPIREIYLSINNLAHNFRLKSFIVCYDWWLGAFPLRCCCCCYCFCCCSTESTVLPGSLRMRDFRLTLRFRFGPANGSQSAVRLTVSKLCVG